MSKSIALHASAFLAWNMYQAYDAKLFCFEYLPPPPRDADLNSRVYWVSRKKGSSLIPEEYKVDVSGGLVLLKPPIYVRKFPPKWWVVFSR